jgi:hypothetical protein
MKGEHGKKTFMSGKFWFSINENSLIEKFHSILLPLIPELIDISFLACVCAVPCMSKGLSFKVESQERERLAFTTFLIGIFTLFYCCCCFWQQQRWEKIASDTIRSLEFVWAVKVGRFLWRFSHFPLALALCSAVCGDEFITWLPLIDVEAGFWDDDNNLQALSRSKHTADIATLLNLKLTTFT